MFNLDALKTSDEIILCESLIDALSFWAAGFRHVTASFGTNGFTHDHRDALSRHSIKRVLIAYKTSSPAATRTRAAELP